MVEQTEYRLNSRRSIQNRETLMPVTSNFEITANRQNRQNRQNRHEGSPPLFLPPFSVILIFMLLTKGLNFKKSPGGKILKKCEQVWESAKNSEKKKCGKVREKV